MGGLAAMLVSPPHPVSGCSQLCVLGVHPGHDHISGGKSIVEGVCGAASSHCAIAMGDWNVDASNVRGGWFQSWNRLIGGTASVVAPDVGTCCNQNGPHDLRFDHAGTNIPGATAGTVKVWDFQLTDRFKMQEEHKPVSVHIHLPTGIADISTHEERTISVLV